jgi:hypothetical protein
VVLFKLSGRYPLDPGCTNHVWHPFATSINIAISAHVELMKSCEALESNNIMVGCSLRKNVPARTSSPMGIS